MKALALTCTLLVLCACATVPENYAERVAAAYSLNAELRSTAADVVAAGHMSREEGVAVLNLTDSVRALLDRAAEGDQKGLDLAIEILAELERLLQ